jgi:hypothetical protein
MLLLVASRLLFVCKWNKHAGFATDRYNLTVDDTLFRSSRFRLASHLPGQNSAVVDSNIYCQSYDDDDVLYLESWIQYLLFQLHSENMN